MHCPQNKLLFFVRIGCVVSWMWRGWILIVHKAEHVSSAIAFDRDSRITQNDNQSHILVTDKNQTKKDLSLDSVFYQRITLLIV